MHRPQPDRRPAPHPLPKATHPQPGEQLASLVERAARDHGVPVADVLHAAGIDTGPNGGIPMWGSYMHPDDQARIAATLRTDPAGIPDTLLTRYQGTLLAPGTLAVAAGASHTLSRAWVTVRPSRCCPICVDENDGAWDVAWKVSGVAVCLRHHVLLADTCPACDTRLREGARGRTLPAYPSLVPDPMRCSNPSPRTSTGRAHRCGHWVTDIDVGPSVCDFERLLDSQDVFAGALEGNPQWLAGKAVHARDWLTVIVELVALARKAASATDIADAASLPDTVLEGWEHFQWERDRARSKGEAAPSYTSPPETSAVAAVAVDLAVGAAWHDRLSDGIDWMVGSLSRQNPEGWRSTPDQLRFGPEMRVAWEEAVRPITGFTRVADWMTAGAPDRSLRPDERDHRPPFGAQHVPHLIDSLVYDERFKAMLPGTADTKGRSFVALCLARAAEGLRSWPETAVALEVDAERAHRIVDVCSRRVDDPVEWWTAVHREVDVLRLNPRPYDYSKARWALRDLVDIDDREWKAICDEFGVLPGRTDGRRRNAAAFAWAVVTGGNPYQSPAFMSALDSGKARPRLVADYRKFVKWLPADAGMRLAEHAMEIRDRHLREGR